ncbi:hypothetical protein EDD29_2300 [Actinocorallia herbida]|uniref:Uncharacterized protein n=1 Tax=Actinocorallia herbida TaxID=58109 RepID=A0A3N1CTY8_9ACTN|nr:hypothetical protein [Actinocorallia herbida]ROO84772.1 hypothetical protein EDD29_2300 [Actinocorallia herbida]
MPVGLVGLAGGVPGALLLAVANAIVRGAAYRPDGPADLDAKAFTDDGFGFAVMVRAVFRVVLGGFLVVAVPGVLRVLRVGRRGPYWLLLCVFCVSPYAAAELSTGAGLFPHGILF